MITLSIKAENFVEAKKKFESFFASILEDEDCVKVQNEVNTSSNKIIFPSSSQQEEVQLVKRGRGRPKKIVEQTIDINESNIVTCNFPSLMEVKEVVQKVIDTKGMMTAQRVIQEFGKSKYGDVDESERSSLIARLNESLNG